jgi:GDPmannose 4,6-dehydratase
MKYALITGINGQDGSYLAEFLLEKEYKLVGIIRRHSVAENQTERIEHIRHKIDLHYGDLTDLSSLLKVCSQYQFDEVYNLGAMSNVGVSFKEPLYTQDVNYLGFIKLVEALQLTQEFFPKLYQASSSEMFGNCVDEDGFQRETTPMMPVSPYGISKLSAHVYAQHLRRAYNLPISSGILFNHESNRRGTNFVTGKVAKAVSEIKLGLRDKLELGTISTFRDWGHSKDYVVVMWQMLNDCEPDDFICCTGKTYSVEYLCKIAFSHFDLDYKKFVIITDKYKRDEELNYLRGCSEKLFNKINVSFEYNFEKMICEMVDYHYKKLTKILLHETNN